MSFWEKTREIQYELIITLSVIIYTVSFSWFTLSKHNTFTTYAWDLGIFDQGFWTTVNLDKIFYYTCELHLSESGSFFGVHFSPILFTIIPIYYLYQSAETLLVTQSLIIALSAIPVYKTAQLFHTKQTSCLLACLYLLNPTLHGINCYDFHVQAFLPLTLGFLIYYTLSRKWVVLFLTLSLTLAVQEQVFYLMIAYLVFLLIILLRDDEQETPRQKRVILLSFLLSITIWKIFSANMIHYFNPNIPSHLRAGQHYAVLGVDDPLKIPLYALTHPGKALDALNYEWYSKIGYLLSLFTPYLIAASQYPLYLIPTIPWFAISLLSNYPPYYRIGFQYSAYIMPFIYTGFLAGTSKITETRDSQYQKNLFKAITILAVIISLGLSPISPLTYGLHLSPAYEKPVETTRTQRLNQIIDIIPEDSSILTQDNIFPHFSNRQDSYVMIPPTYKDVKTWKDAINWITRLETEYILMDLETDPHNTIRYAFTPIRQRNYQLLAFYDNIYLYQRNYTGATISYELINHTYTYSDLIPQHMNEHEDPNSTIGTILQYQNMSIQTNTLWYGPYEIVPIGNYTASFRVKTMNNRLNETITLDAFHNRTILNSIEFTEKILENNTWTPLELNFTLTNIAYDLELRGILVGLNTTIALDTIRLEQRP